MKITIPKVVLTADLGEYAEPLRGQNLHIWVNPPKETLKQYDDLVTSLQERELETARKTFVPEPETADAVKGLGRIFNQVSRMVKARKDSTVGDTDVKLMLWYANCWSQGPEDTRWTVSELRELEEQDPSLLSWMITKTWQTRNEHIQRKKKS